MRAVFPALLFVALAAPARAQADTEVYVDQATAAIGISTGAVLGATTLGPLEALTASLQGRGVMGETNRLVVIQTGTGNALVLSQIGQDNTVGLAQTGNDNTTELAQLGTGNVVLSSVEGSGNAVRGVQQGDGNTYSLVLAGDATDHTVAQFGSGNMAEQSVAPGLLPASIEQRGNGLDVTVTRN